MGTPGGFPGFCRQRRSRRDRRSSVSTLVGRPNASVGKSAVTIGAELWTPYPALRPGGAGSRQFQGTGQVSARYLARNTALALPLLSVTWLPVPWEDKLTMAAMPVVRRERPRHWSK